MKPTTRQTQACAFVTNRLETLTAEFADVYGFDATTTPPVSNHVLAIANGIMGLIDSRDDLIRRIRQGLSEQNTTTTTARNIENIRGEYRQAVAQLLVRYLSEDAFQALVDEFRPTL